MDQISVQIAQLPLCSAQWSIIIFNLESSGEKSIRVLFAFRSLSKVFWSERHKSPFFSSPAINSIFNLVCNIFIVSRKALRRQVGKKKENKPPSSNPTERDVFGCLMRTLSYGDGTKQSDNIRDDFYRYTTRQRICFIHFFLSTDWTIPISLCCIFSNVTRDALWWLRD